MGGVLPESRQDAGGGGGGYQGRDGEEVVARGDTHALIGTRPS